MDADLNKYDLNHAVTGHALMSKAEWERTYHDAWETYYTDEHIETVLQTRDRDGNECGKDDVLYHMVQRLYRHRGNSPARGRIFQTKGQAQPAFVDADGKCVFVLSEIFLRKSCKAVSMDITLPAAVIDL